MAARISVTARSAQPELVITRIFNAPRALVFKAWTQPDQAAIWWGPRGFTTISCEMDVRPGGAWRRCMRAADGSEYRKRGVYREILEPERLVFTYADEDIDGNVGPETLVTVSFADFAGKTRLTLHHAGFASVATRDSHQGGWTGCLERFSEYLAVLSV